MSNNKFTFTMADNSMSASGVCPDIPKGAEVQINRDLLPVDGCLVAAKIDGESLVRKLTINDKGWFLTTQTGCMSKITDKSMLHGVVYRCSMDVPPLWAMSDVQIAMAGLKRGLDDSFAWMVILKTACNGVWQKEEGGQEGSVKSSVKLAAGWLNQVRGQIDVVNDTVSEMGAAHE